MQLGAGSGTNGSTEAGRPRRNVRASGSSGADYRGRGPNNGGGTHDRGGESACRSDGRADEDRRPNPPVASG